MSSAFAPMQTRALRPTAPDATIRRRIQRSPGMGGGLRDRLRDLLMGHNRNETAAPGHLDRLHRLHPAALRRP